MDFAEEEPGARYLHYFQSGTIVSYAITTLERHTWKIPALPLDITENEEQKSARGAFGSSAHTDYAVFWVASEQLSKGCSTETCDSEVESSSIYSARL